MADWQAILRSTQVCTPFLTSSHLIEVRSRWKDSVVGSTNRENIRAMRGRGREDLGRG